jgi:hypothetical protein
MPNIVTEGFLFAIKESGTSAYSACFSRLRRDRKDMFYFCTFSLISFSISANFSYGSALSIARTLTFALVRIKFRNGCVSASVCDAAGIHSSKSFGMHWKRMQSFSIFSRSILFNFPALNRVA